ncbi:M48 family metallopeptidase [Cerasicoccus frondis]|uniref:M48 family metallopeptidase n=1 Tax=Cerasicoccus frondis TaxID=490090 RepID=UPI0028526A98|nr:M48 family metallopeptidase [Cerasicoccus frondis]
MNRAEYETLIRNLTELSEKNPSGFGKRYRRLCLVTFGYPLLLLVLGLAMILLGGWLLAESRDGYLWKLLTLCVGLLILSVMARSFWHQTEAPEGLELDKKTGKALYDDIRNMRKRTKCPKIHRILFMHDVNACITQQPRLLGIFWHRNYLMIGLPLLYMLTLEQFQAVLAHEMGHIVNRDGSSGSFFYRLGQIWGRLAGLDKPGRSLRHLLFLPIYRRIAPRLTAWQQVKGRQAEYRADAFAALHADARHVASSLCKLEATMGFLNQEIQERMRMETFYHREPPSGMMQRIIKLTTQDLWLRRGPYYVMRAMEAKTLPTDTHPCLADRLKSVNAEPHLKFAIESSAGDYYFGAASNQLVQKIDELWCREIMYTWRIQHAILREQEREIQRLRSAVKNEPMPFLRWKLAVMTYELFGPRDSLKYFLDFGREFPNCARIQLAIGVMKLRLEQADCLNYLYKAMQGDPMCYLDGAMHAYEWCLRVNDQTTADTLKTHINTFYDKADDYLFERAVVSKQDSFRAPQMRQNEWEYIFETCFYADDSIHAIYLLEKETQHYTHYPVYVLCVVTHLQREQSDELMSKLEKVLFASGTILAVNHASYKFLEKALKQTGSEYVKQFER